jgi:hypothetical protein
MKLSKILPIIALLHFSCQPRQAAIETKWIGKTKSDLKAEFGDPEGAYTTGLRDPGPKNKNRSEIPIVSIIYGDVSYGLNYRDEIVSITISEK